MSVALASSNFSNNPLWYLTRSTAVVAFVLLTLGTVLGVAATQRELASPGWPRFATQNLHRNVNLLGLVFVVIHIVTTLFDTYVDIGVASVIVPFTSDYRSGPVAWGTACFDLLIVVTITGLLRVRMDERPWRVIHLASYLAWPMALLHFVYTGTDGRNGKWGFWLGMVCAVIVAVAALLRVLTRNRGPRGPVRSVVRAG